MFKKVFNALYCALPDILLIVLFSMWAYQFTEFVSKYGSSAKQIEHGLYGILALVFFRLFQNINKRKKTSRKLRISFAIGVALSYTISLWFLNSYWLFLEISSRLPFHISFKDILWSNLTYTYGKWRYPLAALLMLIACLLLPWVKEKLKPIGEKIIKKITAKLSILLFFDNASEAEAVCEYVDQLPEQKHYVKTKNKKNNIKGESKMINPNENTFTIIDEGKEVVCDILFTFDSADTGMSYIVYTDNSRDTDGHIQVFASILSETDDGNHILLPIQTDKEYRAIEIILDELQTSIREQEGGELTGNYHI